MPKEKTIVLFFFLFNFPRKHRNFIMCPGNGTVKSGHRDILVKGLRHSNESRKQTIFKRR